jgi:hypothetical protein
MIRPVGSDVNLIDAYPHEAGMAGVAMYVLQWCSASSSHSSIRSAEAGLRAERRDASVPTGRDPASGVTMARLERKTGRNRMCPPRWGSAGSSPRRS